LHTARRIFPALFLPTQTSTNGQLVHRPTTPIHAPSSTCQRVFHSAAFAIVFHCKSFAWLFSKAFFILFSFISITQAIHFAVGVLVCLIYFLYFCLRFHCHHLPPKTVFSLTFSVHSSPPKPHSLIEISSAPASCPPFYNTPISSRLFPDFPCSIATGNVCQTRSCAFYGEILLISRSTFNFILQATFSALYTIWLLK